jgi:hypothetical protein
MMQTATSLRIQNGGTWDEHSPTCLWKLATAVEVEPTREWWDAWERVGGSQAAVATFQLRIALVAPMTQRQFRESKIHCCNPLQGNIEMAPTEAGEGKERGRWEGVCLLASLAQGCLPRPSDFLGGFGSPNPKLPLVENAYEAYCHAWSRFARTWPFALASSHPRFGAE